MRKIALTYALTASTLIALIMLWPNLVHEPLHLLGLHLFGNTGTITFDFALPAHPYITPHNPITSITAALTYVLLPSIASLCILGTLWLTRKSAGLITHVVLPTYLIFDLITNLLGYTHTTNDFHFLTYFPHSALILSVIVLIGGATLILKFMQNIHLNATPSL